MNNFAIITSVDDNVVEIMDYKKNKYRLKVSRLELSKFLNWRDEKTALTLELLGDGTAVFTPTEMTVIQIGSG